jgi:hypothetical protein
LFRETEEKSMNLFFLTFLPSHLFTFYPLRPKSLSSVIATADLTER